VTSEGWLFLFVLLLALGAFMRQTLLFVFAAASLLVALASWIWQRYCFHGVTYRRVLSQRRAFFDEEIDLTLEVTNKKLLPLPWLEAEDEVPEGLAYLNAQLASSYKPKRRTLVHLCSPRWYERIRRHYRIRCTERGLHEFGPATLRAGDLFGMSIQRRDEPAVDRLIVYPRIVPLERLGLPVHGPFGDLVTPRTLWEDPTYLTGVRAYQAGDPVRRIHWKASARLGNPQVKLLDPTTHARLALFLDMQTLAGQAWWAGYDPLLVELSVIVATAVAAWAAEQNCPVGLYVNAHRFRSQASATIALPPSEHPEQLHAVLEALATVMPVATLPLSDLLATEAPALPWGTTVLAITALPDADLLGTLHAVRRKGQPTGLVLVGSGAQMVIADGIPVFHVGGEEAWRDVTRVALG
jgi:uncharacterized protein (DUF58 family)